MMMHRHCIYNEAAASVEGVEAQGGKYDAWPIREQAAHYRADGHPPEWGLYATGTLAWAATQRVHKLGEEWLAECTKWSIQDQISFPVVCRRLGINPGTFPFSQIQRTETGSEGWVLVNNWLSIWPHLR